MTKKKKQFFASFFVKDRYFGFVFSSVKAERKCSFDNFRAVAECFKKLKLQRIRKEHFSLRRKELNEKMEKNQFSDNVSTSLPLALTLAR